jgi:Holliday junction resolvase
LFDNVKTLIYVGAMAKTPEAKVKDQVVAALKKVGAYHFFPATHGFGRSGVPDIVACVNGHFLGIECKAGTNKPTALQVREIEHIRANGGTAVVVNEQSLDMLPDLLAKLKRVTIT